MTALTAPSLNCLDVAPAIDQPSSDDFFPRVPAELRASTRWLQATIMNKTPYKIKVERSYFHSGEYYHAPTDVAPYGQMSFSCRNAATSSSRASPGSGVGGATEFRVYTTRDDRWLYSMVFRIGWACPELGSPKIGVVTGGGPAKEAYDIAADRNQEARTERGVAVGRNPDGTWKYMNLRITAIRHGWEPLYVVEHSFDSHA